jgi:hypothetical protein
MRPALLLLLLAAALACTGEHDAVCPGDVVGTFQLRGDLVLAQTACTVEPDGGFAQVAIGAAPPDGAVAPFQATITQDATSDAPSRPAALCTARRLAQPYYGVREADGTFVLEADSGAAVLPACGSTCAASARERITGALATAADGSATFAGTLTETFTYRSGDCGACTRPATASDPGAPLDCTATWAISSVP